MSALPGITQKNVPFTDITIGDALTKFSESPAGKVLSWLDVGAEALERGAGMIAQAGEAFGNEAKWSEFTGNLNAAWYASSLASDLSPSLEVTPKYEAAPGAIPGLSVPEAGRKISGWKVGFAEDLPGISGVVTARKRIIELMAGGTGASAALSIARDEQYNDLGALALRSQMHDMFFHMAADPLNVFLPFLKPVERLQAARRGILATKFTAEAAQEAVTKLDDVSRAVDKAADVLRTAEQSGDAAKITGATSDLAKLQDEFQSISKLAADAAKSRMTRAEQAVVWITGGDPLAKGPTKNILNPVSWFSLTPEAKAHELVNIVLSNVNSRVVAANVLPDGTYNVEAIARALGRATAGSYSPELGHMIVTLEGRAVRDTMTIANNAVQDVAKVWAETGKMERPLLQMIAGALGETPYNVMHRLEAGESAALFAQFMEKTSQNADSATALTRLLTANNVTPEAWNAEQMGARLLVFKGNDLYDNQLAVATMLDKIAETSAKAAVMRFGVKARGAVEAMTNAVKSAETLAFLRLNPAYPVRNYVNNVFTLVARGAFGTMSASHIDDIWKAVGFVPPRLAVGMGMAGEELIEAGGKVGARAGILQGVTPAVELANQSAGEIIRAATARDKDWIDKVTSFFRDVKLGKADTGAWSAKIEQSASRQATTVGWLRGEKYFGKAGSGWQAMGDFNPRLAQTVGQGTANRIEAVARSVHLNPNKLEQEIFTADWSKSIGLIEEAVERKFGRPLHNIIGDDTAARLGAELPDILKTGSKGAVQEYFGKLRGEIDSHIQDLTENALKTLTEETAARVKTEGPGAFAKLWGEAMDDWWGAHEKHAVEISQLADEIKRGVDPELVNARWRKLLADSDAYWGRSWGRLEARFKGMSTSAREIGLLDTSGEVMDTFKSWRGGWKKFFKDRQQAYTEFFDATRAGKPPRQSFEAISAELDARYGQLIDDESRYNGKIDNIVSGFFQDQGQKATFLAWRRRVGEFRRLDKESVLAFRGTLKGLPFEEVEAAYAKHWKDRIGAWANLWGEEQRGLAALQGNPQAAQVIDPTIQRLRQQMDEVFPLIDQRLAGGALDEAQQAALDAFLRENGDPDVVGYLDSLRRNLDDLTLEAALPDRTASLSANQLDPAALKAYGWTRGKRGMFNAVNADRADVGLPKYASLKDVPFDEAVQSIDKRVKGIASELKASFRKTAADAKVAMAETVAEITDTENQLLTILRGRQMPEVPTQSAALPDFHTLVPRQLDMGAGLDTLNYTKGSAIIDELESGALLALDEAPVKFGDFDADVQKGIRAYVEHIKGGMSDARYASSRFSEFVRDSALLNYNRRTNFDSWLSMIMPFEFWGTHSAYSWAVNSIDRPAMLSNYLRIKKFLNTAYRPEEGLPSRLKGKIRIPLPFAPEWMGKNLFVDPLRLALPFDSWLSPFEQAQQQQAGDVGTAKRVLQELRNDGMITDAEYNQAVVTQAGPVWDRAVTLARQDDSEERLNGFDFMSMLTAPHVPIAWAWDVANKREPGAVLPLTNTLGSIYGLLGIDPAGPLNPEAAIRKQLGFHPFNKWDDYRVERMLVNMLADKTIQVDEFNQAFLTHKGDVWETAYQRAAYESSGGPLGLALKTMGLPTGAYPEGERTVRQLGDEYAAALSEYQATGDYGATLAPWLEEHPEYEARLALFKKPEERMRLFLVDQVWDKWNDLPSLTKREMKDALGREFVEKFYDKETRSYDSIPPETMQMWLALLGGEVPGKLEGTLSPSMYRDLQLTDPDKAWRVQTFYQNKELQFGRFVGQALDDYYALEAGDARKSFVRQHPELKAYWDWRNDFIQRNPDVATLISDSPKYQTEEFQQQAAAASGQPRFTRQEWRNQLGAWVDNLVLDYADGEDLPPAVTEQLRDLAWNYGFQGDVERLVENINSSP